MNLKFIIVTHGHSLTLCLNITGRMFRDRPDR